MIEYNVKNKSHILFVAMLVQSPVNKDIQYEYFNHYELLREPRIDERLGVGGKEYWPKVIDQNYRNYPDKFQSHILSYAWERDRYRIRLVDGSQFEALVKHYIIDVKKNSTVILPYAYSGFSIIENENIAIAGYRTESNPCIHIDLLKGNYLITIKFSTIGRMIGQSIQSLF